MSVDFKALPPTILEWKRQAAERDLTRLMHRAEANPTGNITIPAEVFIKLMAERSFLFECERIRQVPMRRYREQFVKGYTTEAGGR